MLQVMLALLEIFQENLWPNPESKNVPKTAKIEGYNTHFGIFPGSELRKPRDAF